MAFQRTRFLGISLVAVGASSLVMTDTVVADTPRLPQVTIDGGSGDGLATPMDPAVEEPIRPLLPGGEILTNEGAAACGTMGGLMLPAGLVMLVGLRLTTTRRYG